MANKHKKNVPIKQHTDGRTVFVRVVACVCALLIICSALAGLFMK